MALRDSRFERSSRNIGIGRSGMRLERPPKVDPTPKEARAIAADLRLKVKGEVRFDEGSRALYATDGSNYRQVPIGVVVPKDVEDIERTVEVCRRHGAPITARGGGTSLAGQCCNVAVVIDTTKYMHRILELDAANKRARVQPGLVLDRLRDAAEKHHLTFAPDPSTHNHCTLGGMIGNNSCGVHSVMGGKTVENVESLDILLYDGTRMRVGKTSDEEYDAIVRAGGRRAEIYRDLRRLRDRYADRIRAKFPRIPRRVSGYNLDDLLPEYGFDVAKALVGTEGTCALVLEAELRLVHSPPARSLVVLGYDDVFLAGDAVPTVMEFGPVGLEGLDDRLIKDIQAKELHAEYLKMFPEGSGFLLVEFGGENKREADDKARLMMARLKGTRHAPRMKLYDNPEEEKKAWEIRKSGLGATARVPGQKDTWEGWEDSAVPPDKLGDYLRVFRKKLDDFGYGCSLYGHFGQGCVHTRIDFDLQRAEGIAKYRKFVEEMADVVVSFGGSLSGEHGDGQSRGELLPKMFGPDIVRAFGEFKAIWDPTNKMNPGKVVHPYRLDENLRLGAHYAPIKVETYFKFPDDKGDFAYVTQRCVGVGECRKTEKGTMCPSYMATYEEMHSTRGRAHLLFEMLVADPLGKDDGALWKNEHVKEALDLCLACKGCKGECPMNVDMPTYKAEFLAHYYEGKVRPRHAYAFGLINVWARFASLAPWLVNFFSQTPPFSSVAKWIAGAAPERQLPRFAPKTFRKTFDKKGAKPVRARSNVPTHAVDDIERSKKPPLLSVRDDATRPQVILWVDTFNDNFHPNVCDAAVEVLEAAGYSVAIPRNKLCCGRPLYDYGMLPRAKQYLRRILDALRTPIRMGVPVVGLEPSCVTVFKDEMMNLFPDDEDAKRLCQQTFLLPDFLQKKNVHLPLKLERKALVHGHCHHKAVEKFDGEQSVLKELGLDAKIVDSGCCGMAGAFGFERGEHYDVSIKVGERRLLPAVREAEKDTIVVADGFSCREQISQTTDRRALHIAQVLQMALRKGPAGIEGAYPEAELYGPHEQPGAPKSPAYRHERSAKRATAMAVMAVFLLMIVCLFLVQLVSRPA